jgi:hypothetical protein
MNLFSIFENDKNIVTLALILIIILGIISYNLYYTSNYDFNGEELGCFDTFRNIFGYLPILSNMVEIVDEIIEDTTAVVKDNIKDIEDSVTKITKKKEVFNIDNNDFTYDEANLVCKAYGAEMATYDQLLSAHKKGANWCNYGWSSNNMALYPTQRDYYNKLQKGDEKYKASCGKPGINGGIFKNKELKFGANCYGYRPEADKSKISYNEKIYPLPEMKRDDELQKERIDELKRKIESGKIQVRPFSDNKWSKYSFKKSTYMLSPNNYEEDDEQVLEIEANITEEEKDPRNIEQIIEEEIDKIVQTESNNNSDVL